LAGSAQTSIHNIAFLEGPKAALAASGDYSVGGKGAKGFGRYVILPLAMRRIESDRLISPLAPIHVSSAYCAWAYSHDWFEERKWEETGATSLEDFMTKNWQNDHASGWDLLSMAKTVSA
jgi:hypothetical protein